MVDIRLLGGAILKHALVLVMSVLLASCGVIYIAPNVSDQMTDATVTITPLNAQNVAIANRSTYRPRSIPDVFFQNAEGTSGLVGQSSGRIVTRLPPPAPQTPYEIGIGDVLVLATAQSARTIEELSGLLAAQNSRQGYTVQDDGAITIPDVGRVQLDGLDLEAAEAEVFQALVSSQLDPTFSIEVAEFNSKRVTVSGAVLQPQILPITLTPLTLQEAVAAAGGTTALDTRFVAIRLFRGGRPYQLPYQKLQETDITLQPNDSIVIDAVFQPELERESFQARLEADAVKRDFVYLTGEVSTQARFPLPFGRQASLADALFEEGGALTETGNPAAIYLLRGHSNGQVTAYHLDARNPVNMINATRMELRPNDIVFVSQQPVTRWNRVVQQLVPSLIISGTTAVTN